MTYAQTYQQLHEILPQADIRLPDMDFALTTARWVHGPFAKSWREKLLDLPPYDPESNDCDDFARLAACHAQLCHAENPKRPTGTALFFGEFWYQRDAGGGHAVCVFGETVEGNFVLGFMEPQTGEKLNLSPDEVRSCEYIRL